MTKSVMRTAVVFALLAAFVQQAEASITFQGTIPPGTTPVVIIQQNNQPGATGVLKFKFSAPTPGSYALNFCIGPTTNPCGLPTSFVVTVPGGGSRLAVVNADVFKDKVLVVAQGTRTAIPFTVEIE